MSLYPEDKQTPKKIGRFSLTDHFKAYHSYYGTNDEGRNILAMNKLRASKNTFFLRVQ